MDLLIGVALVLGVMILVHEWGHFIVARLFKVRVDVFSIGFGPRLFGWKRGNTDYRVSALPVGGYVRMAGQDLSDVDSGNRAPTGAPDELMSKPRWQRALARCSACRPCCASSRYMSTSASGPGRIWPSTVLLGGTGLAFSMVSFWPTLSSNS